MKKILLAFLITGINVQHTNAQVLAAGAYHSFFICNTNSPMACGANGSGQFGIGTTVNTNTNPPVQSSLTGIIAAKGGQNHSIFLKNDSTVWVSGFNGSGQLGDGTTATRTTAVQIPGLDSIIAIAAGYAHSIFLKSDGTVWACGANSFGQLGDGTTTNRNSPVQVNGLTGIIAIAGGGYHSVFLKNDSTVWACGYNINGQLGDSTTVDKHLPFQIASLSGVTSISAGGYHTLYLKNDSTVWSCGGNGYGALGDGTVIQRIKPVRINSLSGITAISAGDMHSLFLKKDGTAWACGYNNYGQLGNAALCGYCSPPTQVNSLPNSCVAIAAGNSHSLFLLSTDVVKACGYNNAGQLGDGTVANKTSPVLVTGLCHILPCIASVTDTLIMDAAPFTWDVIPAYSSNITSARWYWGDSTSTVGLYPGHTYAAAGMYNICVTAYASCGDSVSFCSNDSIYRISASNTAINVNVLPNMPVGISSVRSNPGYFTIAPNPNNGRFVISMELQADKTATLIISDVLGREVYKENLRNTKNEIDLSDHPNGLYNITVYGNGSIYTKKVILNK